MKNLKNTSTPWGQVKFGKKPRKAAITIALPAGLFSATILSALATYLMPRYDIWWQSILIYLIMLTPIAVAGAWALLVDRSTLPGAVRNPEESVEQAWAKTAALNAFTTNVILISIGLTVSVLANYQTISNTLLVVLLLHLAAFAFSYQIEARRK
ncbi:hypothetical protein NXS08_03100 [Gleimia sp. 6138-11-ORH1]|uniref:hypothetical protein n=1 Tax=Gleimia sp. 6138-11-ORH1 TaxID=2973937 RepID=UPI00216727AC|nr:hypothetical protein [Gleimia sp. 6138-11-ORH1]MCS4484476.1 hypothetical protein [Gleimia sp. 6138-11-ORH1]